MTNSIAIRTIPSSVGSSRSKSAITQGAAVGVVTLGKRSCEDMSEGVMGVDLNHVQILQDS